MKRLKNRRLIVLRAVAAHVERHGYAPTLQEISDSTGLSSRTSVKRHLAQLAELGLIEYTPHQARGIRVPLTPGVVTVPVVRCGPCGGDMPADHVCRAVVEDLRRYGTPGDLADTP